MDTTTKVLLGIFGLAIAVGLGAIIYKTVTKRTETAHIPGKDDKGTSHSAGGVKRDKFNQRYQDLKKQGLSL